jgi:hypothetical protein
MISHRLDSFLSTSWAIQELERIMCSDRAPVFFGTNAPVMPFIIIIEWRYESSLVAIHTTKLLNNKCHTNLTNFVSQTNVLEHRGTNL